MNQKGFTLIEMLLAVSITSVIVIGIGSSIFQILQGRVDISQKSIAIADIDGVAHWLTRDMTLAQTTSLIDAEPPTSNISMIWSDLTAWAGDEGAVQNSANYTLSGTQLLRVYNGGTTIVGRYLTNAGFSVDGKMFTVTLTSRPGMPDSAVTRTFQIQMRSDSGP